MKECPTKVELSRLVSDDMQADDRNRIDAHLTSCEQCQQTLDELTSDVAVGHYAESGDVRAEEDSIRSLLDDLKERGPVSDRVNPNSHSQEANRRAADTLTQLGEIDGLTKFDNQQQRQPARIPNEFGNYRIIRPLGRGGMGSVLLAEDSHLERHVAIKVPLLGANDDEKVIERFRREAKALAQIHHPNICSIFEVGEVEGTPFIVMAFVEGKPLSKYMHPETPLKPRQACSLIRKIAMALHDAHSQGVIHRDLKPENILIDHRKEPIVLDFGLARRETVTDGSIATLTFPGQVMGSPQYMSPEQISGRTEEMGPGCDIYSLGAILYELITCKLPSDADDLLLLVKQIAIEEPKPPSQHVPELDASLDAICLTALAKEPSDRFASMQEVSDALASYQKGVSWQPDNAKTHAADDPLVVKTAAANSTKQSTLPIVVLGIVATVLFCSVVGGLLMMVASRPSTTDENANARSTSTRDGGKLMGSKSESHSRTEKQVPEVTHEDSPNRDDDDHYHESRQHAIEQISRFDSDNDDLISRSELILLIEADEENENSDATELRDYANEELAEFDFDRNGKLSLDEMVLRWFNFEEDVELGVFEDEDSLDDLREEVDEAFDEFDEDGDNFLSQTEVADVIKDSDEEGYSDEQINLFARDDIDEFDLDGDLKLSISEAIVRLIENEARDD